MNTVMISLKSLYQNKEQQAVKKLGYFSLVNCFGFIDVTRTVADNGICKQNF